jgi:hypothetical protein
MNAKKKRFCLKAASLTCLLGLVIILNAPPAAAGGLQVDSGFSLEYDMLILVPNIAIGKQFDRLRVLHESEGIKTRLRVLQNPAQREAPYVRGIIQNAYANSHITYVLIAGNHYLFPSYYVSSSLETIVSDQYFACLDEPFNTDFEAEVYVGRAPVANGADAERFVSKTHAYYHDGDQGHIEKVLLVGEQVDFVWGGNWMEQLRWEIPGRYDIHRLYESQGSWTGDDLVSLLNTPPGYHIINHMGHGDVYQAMKLVAGGNVDPDEAPISDLTNSHSGKNDLFFVYTQSCHPGAFEFTGCWAEFITVKDRDGAFAVVANSGIGYYIQDNIDDSPSQMFQAAFMREALMNGETLGAANQISKTSAHFQAQLFGHPQMDKIRHCYYQTNLFGDPAIRLH